MKTQVKNQRSKRKNLELGFTLLEVLVTTAIIGVLFTMASAIFINTIRSANKANITNEAKENASLVIQTLERDVRSSIGSSGGGSSVTLNYPGGAVNNIVWACVTPGSGNRYITRGGLTVTNRDPVNGVSATPCTFTLGGSGTTVLVTLNLGFTQGTTSGASQDLQVLVSHTVSFSNREN